MAASVAIVVLCIAPWTVRNYRAFHQFVPLNTNAGFALFWGNHPTHGTSFVPILPGAEYGALIPKELDGLNEAALDRALLQRAVGFVSDDQVRYLLLSLSRVKEYMKFWPSEESGRLSNLARVLSFGICLPFLVWGCVLVWRQAVGPLSPEARAGVGLLAGIAVVYSLIHLLTWTLVRYRLPIDAVLMPFIGLSMVYACDVLYRWAAPLPGSPRMTRVSG
jgi:hypothetical protein